MPGPPQLLNLKYFPSKATLDRFSKMRLTCSNQCALSKLDTLGEEYNLELQTVKERISKENYGIRKLEESARVAHTCSPVCLEGICQAKAAKESLKQQKTACHPGFIIAFNNIDLEIPTSFNKGICLPSKESSAGSVTK